jgi:hypothetical protein
VLPSDHDGYKEKPATLSQTQDYPPGEFKNNVLARASTAKFFKLPTILTTSFEQGPNGPLVPELKEMFPEAPLIPRPGAASRSHASGRVPPDRGAWDSRKNGLGEGLSAADLGGSG